MRTCVLALVVMLVLAACLFLCWRTPFLCVVNAGSGETLFQGPVTPGYKLSTHIIHSVQLTPVTEYFEVDPDGWIVATGMDHADLGWGLPSTVEGSVEIRGGTVRVRGQVVRLRELRFRVSYINRPRLILVTDRRYILLANLVPDGAAVIVRVENRPRYARYFGGANGVTIPAEDGAPSGR
ncbi:MAG: DUF1850 domain-containing protein [Firmicutes bacterium]|nr:DUF1850 domain-containing protein [Bacillota bacterium]